MPQHAVNSSRIYWALGFQELSVTKYSSQNLSRAAFQAGIRKCYTTHEQQPHAPSGKESAAFTSSLGLHFPYLKLHGCA